MIVSIHSLGYFVSGYWCTASLITTMPTDYAAITSEIITQNFDFITGGKLRIDLSHGYFPVDVCEYEIVEEELRPG